MLKKMVAFAPGRTEIAGNHVDHQHGIAVTGSLLQGISADVDLREDKIIRIMSEGFDPFEVNIDDIKNGTYSIKDNQFTSKALVAGVVRCFLNKNIELNGFDAKIKTTIPSGMGLSSSASFELLIGVILNEAFADGFFNKMELAQIGQYAENEYYGKPCGLLDQTAISYGGIIQIDFEDPENLKVESIDFSFDECGLAACLVDSGAEHGDISNLYAAIPSDMKKIADVCDVEYLGETSIDTFSKRLIKAQKECGDKAVLRGIHYFREIGLVLKRIEAMKNKDVKRFCALHGMSGISSAQYLQNVSVSDTDQTAQVCQGIAEMGLDFASGGDLTNRGATRIHGGGFGGCIQVFLPKGQLEKFKSYVDGVYGKQVCQEIGFSQKGA